MKVIFQRRHVIRPENYESLELVGRFEIDSDNEEDSEYFDKSIREIGRMLSEDADDLLDADVDRALRLEGQHIQDTHLWVFYEKD
jgi:hypothetical protein